jgi:uncharacterized membrane protein YraQ (UPF0718 family)
MTTSEFHNQSLSLHHNRRFLFVAAFALLTAMIFWFGSRYPQLNEKAMMGANTHIEALSFDTIVDVPDDASLPRMLVGNSVNWIYTNRKGMTFGIIFGALLMTMLPFFSGLQFRSRIANSILGIVLGSPLGLCVNCSTPVAVGLYAGGARTETMIATMVSSPTLNIIVVTMMFSLFPIWLVTLKLAMTLAFAVFGIPLLTRWALPAAAGLNISPVKSPSANLVSYPYQIQTDKRVTDSQRRESWFQALFWVMRNFTRNLWHIVRTTVPLMLLAGILGATIVTFIPFRSPVEALPHGHVTDLAWMSLVALFGICLPVPMVFDVIVTAALMNAGLSMKYVIVLLFTLGIFSIYPFFLIWRDVSPRLAAGLLLSLAALGVIIGAGGGKFYNWDHKRQVINILRNFAESGRAFQPAIVDRAQQGRSADELVSKLQATATTPAVVMSGGELTITQVPFNPHRPSADEWFTRIEGPKIGIDEPANYSPFKIDLPPFPFHPGHGIAAGDVHNDGWTDLVVGSDSGLALYANDHGRFVRQRIDIPELNDLYISNVALVDLNNDGWLDLYVSTLRHGNYVIYNQNGKFLKENLKKLPNHPHATVSNATAFGDLSRKGLLDIVIGNVSWCKPLADSYCDGTQNVILKHRDVGHFDMEALPGINGQTLSILISDVNQDGWPDLIVGNDFEIPDMYYLGDGKGGLRIVPKADGLVQKSTRNTMSVTSADIQNDLNPAIYLAQVTFKGKTLLTPKIVCAEYSASDAKEGCEQFYRFRDAIFGTKNRGGISDCLILSAQTERDACFAHEIIKLSQDDNNKALCDQFPVGWDYLSFVCDEFFAPQVKVAHEEMERAIPQQPFNNMLLKRDASGVFKDQASTLGLTNGGWSWNAKFADLDNDGWQDLYIGTGYIMMASQREGSRFLYHNEQGKKFTDVTVAAGLTSYVEAESYVYVDINNDGNLDIVVVPEIGPVIVYMNNSQTGNAIDFELRDERGNRFGVGSKIYIYYGDGQHQMREILASGGYRSFDAPIVHFGLGDRQTVQRVEIQWSTGERSVIEQELAAGSRYVVTRAE